MSCLRGRRATTKNPQGGGFGRGDWIRTSDLFVPNEARYQAAPRPDWRRSMAPYAYTLKRDSLNAF